jgi:hypothetical protein
MPQRSAGRASVGPREASVRDSTPPTVPPDVTPPPTPGRRRLAAQHRPRPRSPTRLPPHGADRNACETRATRALAVDPGSPRFVGARNREGTHAALINVASAGRPHTSGTSSSRERTSVPRERALDGTLRGTFSPDGLPTDRLPDPRGTLTTWFGGNGLSLEDGSATARPKAPSRSTPTTIRRPLHVRVAQSGMPSSTRRRAEAGPRHAALPEKWRGARGPILGDGLAPAFPWVAVGCADAHETPAAAGAHSAPHALPHPWKDGMSRAAPWEVVQDARRG